jgi:hypothetical protein
MSSFEYLLTEWGDVEQTFMASEPIRRLVSGSLTVEHYAAWLRETYFYTREDPQIQAVATAWFRGEARAMVKPFLAHAMSEVGHDRMALDDLASLGYRIERLPDEDPLPGTVALSAFAFYGMQHRSPVSYLGYLFFLEFLPTSRGNGLADVFRSMGVAEKSMSFLLEHNTVDMHHNKAMQVYADKMLRSEADLREAVYAMRVTGYLYRSMLECAFASVDAGTTALLRERVA